MGGDRLLCPEGYRAGLLHGSGVSSSGQDTWLFPEICLVISISCLMTEVCG